jgi:hypothetical protein
MVLSRFSVCGLVTYVIMGACVHINIWAGDAETPISIPPIPPSPSTAPGVRIWPDPQFTHWPAVAYDDETRNIAFSLPIRPGIKTGTIGWEKTDTQNQSPWPLTLPDDAESTGGLLPLPLTVGVHRALAQLGDSQYPLNVRVVDAHGEWPLVRLQRGFPVDDAGTAVVLLDHRRGTREERMWSFLDTRLPRPSGRALIIGDALVAFGQSTWDDLDADLRPVHDERYPQHAALIAFAAALRGEANRLPRTIIWSPGNQVIAGAAWSAEEERVLGVVRTRLERLGVQPRLILCLPPLPVEAHYRTLAEERRALLQRSASRLGWIIVDAARLAGEPEQANQLSDGVFTTYPHGQALKRIRDGLREALKQ